MAACDWNGSACRDAHTSGINSLLQTFMHTRFISLAASGTLCLCSLSLFSTEGFGAAIVATPGPLTPTRSGNVNMTSNSLAVTQVDGTHVKISGDANFTKTNSSTGTITTTVQGTIDVDTDDIFNLAHDFNFTLTGAGSVTWTLTGQLDLGFPFGFQTIASESSAAPMTAGSQRYSGSESAPSPFEANTAWRGILTVTWSGGGAGDTLFVSIPSNSIDFRLNPIPEPSTASVFAIGAAALIARRRR